MTMQSSRIPSIGNQVITADGTELGKVKEIVGDCFKIDAPMAPDYWLGTDVIGDTNSGAVYLNLDKRSLDNAKMDQPGHSGYHRHN